MLVLQMWRKNKRRILSDCIKSAFFVRWERNSEGVVSVYLSVTIFLCTLSAVSGFYLVVKFIYQCVCFFFRCWSDLLFKTQLFHKGIPKRTHRQRFTAQPFGFIRIDAAILEPISCGANGQGCIELHGLHACAFLYLLYIEYQKRHFIGLRIGFRLWFGSGLRG